MMYYDAILCLHPILPSDMLVVEEKWSKQCGPMGEVLSDVPSIFFSLPYFFKFVQGTHRWVLCGHEAIFYMHTPRAMSGAMVGKTNDGIENGLWSLQSWAFYYMHFAIGGSGEQHLALRS